jgi:hypothetical protein
MNPRLFTVFVVSTKYPTVARKGQDSDVIPKPAQEIALSCVVIVIVLLFCPLAFAAGTDALLQGAANDYAAMKESLVKKYEEQYKRGEELDRKYRQENNKDTIRNQVAAWQAIITDGYDAISGFVKSGDFDKAHIIYYDYYFNQSFFVPLGYKDSWSEEIGPALSAVRRCCDTDDSNDCEAQIYEKAFPYFRDFANRTEAQVGGFFRSVDQSKLSYYDDYYKKTRTFTYTWPKNAEKLLNFLQGDSDWDRKSRMMDKPGLNSASLLTINLRSNQGRLIDMYVTLQVQNSSSGSAEHFWLREFLEDSSVIEEGGNYLVLKRENRYYRLVHFYKGRKSLAVVYTLETDKTIDAMARYLILALRDYVVTGAAPAPAPAPAPGPAVINQMEMKPLTSTNLQTSPGTESTCTLQILVADPKGAPVASVAVTLEKPMLGTLSALQVTTDAQGRAQVIYTAPTEAELAQQGEKEMSVLINAREGATGAKDSTSLNIRSRLSAMTVEVEHAILPAHPDFYNTIRFRFQAANKKDGSAYQARIRARQQWGALVKDSLQQGGAQSYAMGVWPNQECSVSYHWIGPASMMQAADEIITVEIPELGLKQEVSFSVGIDLALVSVQRKYGGQLLPLLWEPFDCYIQDRFHPGVDLAALLAKFRIQPGLVIEQTFYAPAVVDPAETGFLSALFTRLEGSDANSLHSAVAWAGGEWEVQKTADNRFVLVQKGRYNDGTPWIDYPAIVFWERGSYQFKVMLKPGAFDADPRTDTAVTEVFTVEAFRGMADEVIHTVFLPSIEFLAGALAGYTESLPLKFAFCLKGLAGDIYGGNYQDFLLDAWGCSMDAMGASKLPVRVKQLFDRHTLALYTKTLVDTLAADQPISATKGVEKGTKAAAPTPTPTPTPPPAPPKYDLDRIMQIAQLAVKGSKESYLVILERQGLEGYAAEIEEETLTPAPAKVHADQIRSQRIEQGERFVVIPCDKDEQLLVRLSGQGTAGRLIIVTPDVVKRYAYPDKAWESTVVIDKTGQAVMAQGEILLPMP